MIMVAAGGGEGAVGMNATAPTLFLVERTNYGFYVCPSMAHVLRTWSLALALFRSGPLWEVLDNEGLVLRGGRTPAPSSASCLSHCGYL